MGCKLKEQEGRHIQAAEFMAGSRGGWKRRKRWVTDLPDLGRLASSGNRSNRRLSKQLSYYKPFSKGPLTQLGGGGQLP